jgi:hypothetical protein
MLVGAEAFINPFEREAEAVLPVGCAGIGACAGVSGAAGLSFEDESLDDFVPFTFAVLLAFSFSLTDGAGLFDFVACFDPPPMRLRRMFHLPLPGSSSGKSCESVDMAEAGRISASGILLLVGDGLRW